MRLSLFGRPAVSLDSGAAVDLGGPALTLLAYLALAQRRLERAEVAALFYPQAGMRRGRATISKVLWELRAALGDDAFERTYSSIALAHRSAWVDALEFESALRRIDAGWNAPAAAGATLAAWLTQTLALYRGLLLQDVFLTESPALQAWHTVEQERFRRLYLRWAQRLVQLHLAQKRWPEAAAALDSALRLEPLDEPLWMLRLQLLAAQGQWEQIPVVAQSYQRRLLAELDTSPTRQFRSLLQDLQSQRTRRPAEPAPAPPPPHLAPPALLTYPFGREVQIERVVRKLLAPGERLLSLVGLGGAGKTVLALAAAARLAPAFRSGACFVSLADLRPLEAPAEARTQVALAIAVALGLEQAPAPQMVDALGAFLADKEILLVLDNCEHLLAAAPLLTELLAGAPQLRILATSRQRLNLAAESLEPVASLPTPSPDASLADLMDNPAAQLFTARARRVLPSFELTADNAAAVGRICRLAGGLPLAVELAAHWVTAFTPAEIAAAIERQIGFLVTPYVDVPERQRSLLAVIERSWRLLSPEEQRALAALSLFQHRFDRQTAQAVAACDLAVLHSLTNRSLLDVYAPGVYVLHPLIKAAATKRADPDPADERYLAAMLRCLQPDAPAPADPPSPSPALFESLADIAHAWELAVARRRCHLLAEVLPRFGELWRDADQPAEAIRLLGLLRTALEADAASRAGQPTLLGWVYHQMALTYRYQDLNQAALRSIEQARRLLEPHAGPSDLGRLLADFGVIAFMADQPAAAEAALQQALAIATAQGDLIVQIKAERWLSTVAWARGDWARAGALCRAALATASRPAEFGPVLFDVYWEVFRQSAMSWRWDLAGQTYDRVEAWCAGRCITPLQTLYLSNMRAALRIGQERWRVAYEAMLEALAAPATINNQVEYCLALAGAARIAQHIDPPAALAHAEAAFAVAVNEKLAQVLPDAHGALGCVLAQHGRQDEARSHLVHQIELSLQRQGQNYVIRHLMTGLFYLARLEQDRLPRPLFEQIVALAATHFGAGTITHSDAQRLARCEGIALAEAESRARQPANWAEMAALAGELLRCVRET